MIKSNSLLLLISFVVLTPIISHGMEQVEVEDPHKAGESKTEIQAPAPSSFSTRIFYGIARKTGLTGVQAYLEREITLEGDILAGDINTPLSLLHDATEERFLEKQSKLTDRTGFQNPDPRKRSSQEKILEVFKLTQKTNKRIPKEWETDFGVQQTYAKRYDYIQKTALETIIDEDAQINQPELARIRDEKIAAAHEEYRLAMALCVAFAGTAAKNKRYVYKRAQEQVPYDLQEKKHYETIDSYTKLLELRKSRSRNEESKI